MIVARVTDPQLRHAVRAAAHREEDVITDAVLAVAALQLGFPRLVVVDGGLEARALPADLRVIELDSGLLRSWDADRRAEELPQPRVEYLARRLRGMLERVSTDRTWVDAALADLSRAAGAQLPAALRTFARRVLEFPVHYTTLHALAEGCEMSRGALKARFRRRGLASPYTYLRWFRIMAVSHVLSDRTVTVASAARRLGFTSDGNLCRMMGALTGSTPTELRTLRGWNRLLISFAWIHLTPEALDAWAEMGPLFGRRVA